MNVHAGAPVIAGIDYSPASQAVIDVARREAALRNRDLRVLPAGPGLVAGAHDAALLVVGVAGAAEIAAHSTTPVLVARGQRHPDGPVVAGVDGSRGSAAALEFAAEEASLRNAELIALHAWNRDDGTELNAGPPMTYEFRSGEDEERRVLAEAVAGIAERFPDLRIRRRSRRDSARRLLHDWSLTAQLVVVGDRGHTGVAGLLLGSVSRHLLRHGGCPTAIVRPSFARLEATPMSVVVAAVDDDAGWAPVLTFARDEATRLGLPLRVVHVSTDKRFRSDAMAGSDRLLTEMLSECEIPGPAERPDVERQILHDDDPARALIDATREAALLVTGSGAIGETVRRLAGRTACPLVVVPRAAHAAGRW